MENYIKNYASNKNRAQHFNQAITDFDLEHEMCYSFRFIHGLCDPIIEKSLRSNSVGIQISVWSDRVENNTQYLRKVFTEEQNIFFTANLDKHQICYESF